jgi:hypothetical protein
LEVEVISAILATDLAFSLVGRAAGCIAHGSSHISHRARRGNQFVPPCPGVVFPGYRGKVARTVSR